MKLRLIMISRFRKATYIQMILAMSLFLGLTAIGLTNAAGKPAGAGVSQDATKSSTKNSEKEKSTNTATRRQTPKNKDAPAETAWGKPVKGLQAGLAFKEGSNPCRGGGTIRFVFKVRNVSDQAINLEYTEPVLKAWAPNISRSDGTAVPLMPPVLPLGGRLRKPSLAPGESLTLDRDTLTIRPLGWEEPITRTVVFAEGGKHKLSHTFTFGPHPYHPSGVDRWAGELTSGELELDVIPAKNEPKPRDNGVGASKEEIQIILRLLGDYERDRLTGPLADHDSEGWWRKREAWEARCAVLTAGAVDYLGYVATGHPDKEYRRVACDALDETKQGDVVRPLVKCLTDEYWWVRQTAARSLGHLRQEAIVHHLLKVLLSDDAASVRTGAAYALGHIGSNRATQGLVKALRSDDSAGVKSAAALAIGWITDPAALPVLKEVLSGADGTLRDYLEAAIRNIEDPEYWGLGVKRGKYESEVYRSLLSKLDLDAVPGATEKRELPDLFGERPLGSGSYHMRKGVTMAFESPPTGGRVYYIRHKKVFYLREYSADPDAAHYYGPFKGNPHEIVRRIWDVRK